MRSPYWSTVVGALIVALLWTAMGAALAFAEWLPPGDIFWWLWR